MNKGQDFASQSWCSSKKKLQLLRDMNRERIGNKRDETLCASLKEVASKMVPTCPTSGLLQERTPLGFKRHYDYDEDFQNQSLG